MEEKLAIASYNNLYELLNQRLEILNICRLKKKKKKKKKKLGYLVGKI